MHSQKRNLDYDGNFRRNAFEALRWKCNAKATTEFIPKPSVHIEVVTCIVQTAQRKTPIAAGSVALAAETWRSSRLRWMANQYPKKSSSGPRIRKVYWSASSSDTPKAGARL